MRVASILVCFPAAAGDPNGDPSRCLDASLHSSDAALDLAVLFISAADLPYVALGDSDAVTSNQPVTALGYPFGRQLEVGRVAAPDLVPDISTSSGTISALRADDAGQRRALQINGTVNPGNSGGPLVDRDGYAVGVIRARVVGDAGIAFAIPINQAKDFLEARGLDALMPAPRLRLGPLQTLEGKGVALRLPFGVADTSPFRARVESDAAASSVVLRIDRALSPWTAKQVESTLIGTPAFERVSVEASESQVSSRSGRSSLLIGRATGTIAGDARPAGIYYGILELNSEKLVARYVGPAEHLAYNEHVLRESLLSLDGQRLAVGDMRELQKLDWSAGVGSTAGVAVPMPCWLVHRAGCAIDVRGTTRPAVSRGCVSASRFQRGPSHRGLEPSDSGARGRRRRVFRSPRLPGCRVVLDARRVARRVLRDRRRLRQSRRGSACPARGDCAGGEERGGARLARRLDRRGRETLGPGVCA